jgi:hypothetical protein
MRGLGYAYQDSILGAVHCACQELGYDALCLTGGMLAVPDSLSSVYSLLGPNTSFSLWSLAGSL